MNMSKVTSKYQVSVPKTIAERYNIRPGDEIEWMPAGDVIRVVPSVQRVSSLDRESKLRLYDQATQRLRKSTPTSSAPAPRSRGWRREDLYQRGRSR